MEVFEKVITQLVQYKIFSALDIRLALFMLRLAKPELPPEQVVPANLRDWTLFLSVALLSRWSSAGHVLIDLTRLAGKFLAECLPQENKQQPAQTLYEIINRTGQTDTSDSHIRLKNLLSCPQLESWRACLQETALVGAENDPEAVRRPLILDTRHRLYLQRYWSQENCVAEKIKIRLVPTLSWETHSLAGLKACLNRLFPFTAQKDQENRQPQELKESLATGMEQTTAEEIDWQKVAVATALFSRFCVISGGPGTGKTTTVVKILVLFLEQHLLRTGASGIPWMPQIFITAPTGKAAARLAEAIQQAKLHLDCSEQIKAALPLAGYTIHRFLYALQMNKQSFLPDLVVVDEASMVDLSLMARLLTALPDSTRLILLGDKDQLASVEAGAVLGDICAEAASQENSIYIKNCLFELTGYALPGEVSKNHQSIPETQPVVSQMLAMRDAIVLLNRNYRFGADSRIMALSQAIRQGSDELVMALLRQQRLEPARLDEGNNVFLKATKSGVTEQKPEEVSWFEPTAAELLFKMFRIFVREYFYDYVRAKDIRTLFASFNRFRILCALRQGPWGVININQLIEYLLRSVGFIDKQESWYLRRPIIVTKNDYNLKLFNGDIGILWQEQVGEGMTNNTNLRAFFPDPEKKDHFRAIPLQILPEHETAFAMTVHKSQGSEFDEVLLLLPFEDSPLISRELLYTAVTRTRHRLLLWGQEPVIRKGVMRKIERLSGLKDKLWV